MNFYSQAGQDRFVFETLIKPGIVGIGSFLDIGCAGKSISNTLGLEELGWRGWLIDNSEEAQKDSADRPSTFILADATQLDYSFLPPVVDYLSLDVDGASLDALKKLPLHRTRFRVITIETDWYRFGDAPRAAMREILSSHGYDLIHADVCNPEPFEDWWLDQFPDSASMCRRTWGKHWKEIVGQ